LHGVRWAAAGRDRWREAIAETGDGLTLGMHSRIDRFADEVLSRLPVGNVYVNRNMIGAIVGSQPFGGRGLSGTGPKAGGPNYLVRLVKEKASPDNIQMTNLSPDELDLHHAPDAEAQVQQLMENSLRDEKIWRSTALNDRISAVRQLLAKIATVDIIDELADDLGSTLADARAQLNRLEKH